MAKTERHLQVQKTYKLYIVGKFVRGEKRSRPSSERGASGALIANYCRASGKDFRDAVVAARLAFSAWSKQSAYLREQILYRGTAAVGKLPNSALGKSAKVGKFESCK